MTLFPSGFQFSARKVFSLLHIRPLASKVSQFGEKGLTSKDFNVEERIASSLQTCSDIRSLRKLHACILTRGLLRRIHLSYKLLYDYATINSFPESRLAFSGIAGQNLFLSDAAIVRYFKGGHFEEVLQLYLCLKLRGFRVDSTSITFGLKSCSELGDVEFGRGIHADAYKVGLNAGKFVGSSLVGLYSRCVNVENADKAFEEILDKDVVAYTSMVTGYARSCDSHGKKAFEITRDMLSEGLDANRVTLVSLLKVAGCLEALKEGRSIHCYAIRRGIGLSDEVLETSLVGMYARCGAATAAASLLSRPGRRTIASWNAMIAGLVHQGRTLEALGFFHIMGQQTNLSPDSITLTNLLAACFDLSFSYQVEAIHGYLIRREISLDLVTTTVLIDAYSRCDRISYAEELFAKLMVRDVIVYNVMICGYLQNGRIDGAIKTFNNMIKEGVRPNSATLLSLLPTFAELSDISRGRWIHGFAVRYGLQAEVNVSNQILDMYAKCGCINIAEKVFNTMRDKDLVSWTSMMMGYVGTGLTTEALALFRQMQGLLERPDSVTIVAALQAISHMGRLELLKEIHGYTYRTRLARETETNNSLITTYAKCGELDMAKNVFNSMAERELTSWNTIISAFEMHGYGREVLFVFDQMQRENVRPNAVTFTSLLSACSHGGLVDEGLNIFCSMESKFSIAPKEEHLGCMVDLLGRAGRLEEAYEFTKSWPLRDRSSALCALLAASRTHGNTSLGEIIGRQLLDWEPHNSRNYTLVSNVYAQASRWSESAVLRDVAGKRGLRKMPGYSLIESKEQL